MKCACKSCTWSAVPTHWQLLSMLCSHNTCSICIHSESCCFLQMSSTKFIIATCIIVAYDFLTPLDKWKWACCFLMVMFRKPCGDYDIQKDSNCSQINCCLTGNSLECSHVCLSFFLPCLLPKKSDQYLVEIAAAML